MANFGSRRTFHDFKYLEVQFFFIFLEVIIDLGATLQKIIEKHQLDVILPYFKKNRQLHVQYAYLHRLLKLCSIFFLY